MIPALRSVCISQVSIIAPCIIPQERNIGQFM